MNESVSNVMIPDNLSEKELSYRLDRIRWLEQEITRYRDYEWKATSFNAAFFVSLLYILLDEQKRQFILDYYKFEIILVVILYLLFALFQLLFIHQRLGRVCY